MKCCHMQHFIRLFTLSKYQKPLNSEDPDEIPHNAAFNLGQHCDCLVRQNQFKEEIQYFLENYNLY